jgi:trans-aconitate 2-methyltransferase
MSARLQGWNSELYQSSHSYIWHYGRDLLALLDAKPGERILDVGCGTGQLSADIAGCGAEVIGIDASGEMIADARRNFSNIRFEVARAETLSYVAEFDAVFSNAALHWVVDQQSALAAVAHALKPGGRFVFEMGGHENLRLVLHAGCEAMRSLGVPEPESRLPWFFPSIGEYAPMLESHGLTVKYAALFDRPTPLEGDRGFARWIEMFGNFATMSVAAERRDELARRWEELARPMLFHNGVWTIDHTRLRMLAIKS